MSKQVHLKIVYKPWKGQQQVPLEESNILYISHFEVNDHLVFTEHATLDLDGLVTIAISGQDISDDYRAAAATWVSLREEFSDPEDHQDGTNEDTLILSVSSIEVVEMPIGTYAGRVTGKWSEDEYAHVST